MTADTRTEYGVRFTNKFDGNTNLHWSENGVIDAGRPVPAHDLPALRAAVKDYNAKSGSYWTAELVARRISDVVPVPEPLPTTLGSIIRADYDGHRSTYVLDGFFDPARWTNVGRQARDARGAGDDVDRLTNIVVLFDAAGSEEK